MSVDVAVELWDPIGARVVSEGVRVWLEGRGEPMRNASGRFVWLGSVAGWPSRLDADTGDQPFVPIRSLDLSPRKPADWPSSGAAARLIRVPLVPDSRYPPSAVGVCGLRGVVGFEVQQPARRFTPLRDAELELHVRFQGTGLWGPLPTPLVATTDARGEFALYGRIPVATRRQLIHDRDHLAARLVITHGGEPLATPDDFGFSRELPPGHLPDGMPLASWVVIDRQILVAP